ncbi:MAG: sigma-70 family RNA polymerase sigma factor [Saprospiraceae bacterium]|nr:sigma-70 family RNA polymerase sigma factor [Saprospiraceae bacterium]
MNTTIKILNLITECKNGNRLAHRQLYNMYKVKMFTLCMRYMSCKQDAEDMLQEGWVKVFRELHSYDTKKGTFYGWIRRIFVNTNLEFLRKKRLKFDDLNDQSPDRSLAYEMDVFAQMGLQEVVNLLQSLPNGYRSVFNLYVIEGYTHREIGEILKISPNTSKTQLMKAKQLMQSKVKILQAV